MTANQQTLDREHLYGADLVAAQLGLEEEMTVVGRDRFYRQIEEAKTRGEESGTGYGSRLMKKLVGPMTAAIEAFIDDANSGKAGRRHTAARYIDLVEPEVAAFLTLKTALDSITKREVFQRTATRVAVAIQDEVWASKYRDANRGEFRKTMQHVEHSTSRRHKQKVGRIMAKRVGVDEAWPAKDMLLLGGKLLDMLREATGLIEVCRVTEGANDTKLYVQASQDTLAWIDNANSQLEFLSPAFLPTVIPPKPWTSPTDGAYWSGLLPRLAFVKTHNRAYLEELDASDPKGVYEAVNVMQATPWRVNKRVVEVFRAVWGSEGMNVKKLPAKSDEELPAKPVDIATNEAAKKRWKKAAALVHASNGRLRSKRLQLEKTLHVADKFAGYERIYFPHNLDFRGRIYAIPMFLNPQGPDYAKAFLTFADGKPILDGTAAGWLAIHGANTYGYDKASLADRVAWVEDRNDIIEAVAADPFGDAWDFWTKADKPWQFLAFCFDWAGFLAEGYGYTSSLPIALDGSCNGLQHYSAALRDPVGGAAVNLLPSDRPQDIYARVAEVTLGYVKAFARPEGCIDATLPDDAADLVKAWEERGVDYRTMAERWLAFGIDRSVTKRPVMTMPYGSTMRGCLGFLETAVRERLIECPNVFATEDNDGAYDAALWLLPLVWRAIGAVVKAARVGMGWLKDCAKLAADEGLPLTWTTPDGFLVQQLYRDFSKHRIKTHIDGVLVTLTLQEALPEVDKRLQQQAVAPNWVHSMDATAMRMFVTLAAANGVQHFALIHDSYGTVAADVEMISATDPKRREDTRTDAQREALAGLLADLRRRFPQARIVGHRDLDPAEACPSFNAREEFAHL